MQTGFCALPYNSLGALTYLIRIYICVSRLPLFFTLTLVFLLQDGAMVTDPQLRYPYHGVRQPLQKHDV